MASMLKSYRSKMFLLYILVWTTMSLSTVQESSRAEMDSWSRKLKIFSNSEGSTISSSSGQGCGVTRDT